MTEAECSLPGGGSPKIEVVNLQPEEQFADYQQAMNAAREVAEQRLGENMLMSWYDRDRDYESPPNTTECAGDCEKNGYIHYGVSHGATLKVDVEGGRFVFFFAPVEW